MLPDSVPLEQLSTETYLEDEECPKCGKAELYQYSNVSEDGIVELEIICDNCGFKGDNNAN